MGMKSNDVEELCFHLSNGLSIKILLVLLHKCATQQMMNIKSKACNTIIIVLQALNKEVKRNLLFLC
jgi:hypothetical protein